MHSCLRISVQLPFHSVVMGRDSSADKLMNPACHGDDKESADDGGSDYREPLLGDESEATHKPDSGRDEEKAEVPDKKVGHFVDPHEPDKTKFQSGGQQEHTYDTRRHGNAGQVDHQFAHREESEEHSAL